MTGPLIPVSESIWGLEYSAHGERCCGGGAPARNKPAAATKRRAAAATALLIDMHTTPSPSSPSHHHTNPSLLALPRQMLREVASVFPGVDVEGVAVVPTCQRARVDLVRTGEEPEGEKDRLLEQV